MENIKLFEEFILETSSKKLNDVNNAIKNIIGKSNTLDIEIMLYYILCANENYDKLKDLSDKVHNFRESIIRDKDFTFDMDEAIENYKKLTKYNNGEIRQLYKDIKVKEDEHHINTLESIENILKHYKKTKNVDSVNYHDFVEYMYKGLRVLNKTDKNSKASINNIIGVILKNGIDIAKISKGIEKYESNKKDDNLIILNHSTVKASEEMDDDERHNDKNYPVLSLTVWKEYKNNGMLDISLFVNKKDYFIGLGYVASRTESPIIAFREEDGPVKIKEDSIKYLNKHFELLEEHFGKDTFKEIMENIFKIFADGGAVTNFDYDYLREKISK